jgi:hypothetical protein
MNIMPSLPFILGEHSCGLYAYSSRSVVAILVLSFIVALSYDIGYKNQDSGFAIGQWMVAVLTTVLAAIYFHLADMA